MEQGDELPQWTSTRVQRHLGGIGLHEKAVVDSGLCRSKREGFVSLDTRIGCYVANGDVMVVDGQVLIGAQRDFSARYSRCATEVEIAGGNTLLVFAGPVQAPLTCGS